MQTVGISLVAGAAAFPSAGAKYSLNSLVAFCCAKELSRTWESDCNIFFIFISGLARGFFAESITITGINAPGLFTAVDWITVPFALLPTSLSGMTLAHGQTWRICCGLWTGSGWELGVLVAGCFGSSLIFLIFSITPLPTFLLSLTWYMRALNLPGQPAVQGCLSLKASYLGSWGVLVSAPELKASCVTAKRQRVWSLCVFFLCTSL